MRTLVAAALLTSACADETSLMQERVKKVSLSSETKQQGTSKLLETAVNMIKNGVTPDVIEFVDATNAQINDEALVAIQSEHDIDQAYIYSLCEAFDTAIAHLATKAEEIAGHDTNRLAATQAHHECRADEAFKCAKSRRCEEQLREEWRAVKREETIMREIHDNIHDEWCVHPPAFCPLERHEDGEVRTFTNACWLSNSFYWADMSPYPVLSIPGDVTAFRTISKEYFEEYMEQKIIVERHWRLYREKLGECAILESDWEVSIEPCDIAQRAANDHACSHAISNRQARAEFGAEWDRILSLYNDALIAKTANEQDRKNEWETLTIVQCLLNHVHSEVVTSIETGGPCPTIDSDPDGVTLAIEDCHIVTRGCGPDSLTAHLCLHWCDIPEPPTLPEIEPAPCSPEYVAREQASFLSAIQVSYTADLSSENSYANDGLIQYETVLSSAGWAGCAPPLVCVDCAGMETALSVPTFDSESEECLLHQEYLSPGQSDQDTFRCLGGWCVSMQGRCNGIDNCGDGSDELGCDAETDLFVPAYIATAYTCPADMHSDVHVECGNGLCIDKVGLCNGHDNCGNGFDEAHCSGSIEVTVEATSGRTITVESLQMSSGVFHDREYSFDSLGHFVGKTFIKYSNDDKFTDHSHVMTKIRTEEALTVYVVKLDAHSLPWLQGEGYELSAYSGVSFSGIRGFEGVSPDDYRTPSGELVQRSEGYTEVSHVAGPRHKEWDETLLTVDHFSASAVWTKTFPAGTISLPGNGGGDGSFLIFVDRPGNCDAMAHQMIQGCLNSPRDLEPDCNLADVRCCSMDGTSCNSGNFPQTYTFLSGLTSDGTACEAGECNGVANTWCHSGVSFGQAQEICAANGERLCTRAEVEGGVCCGTGCSHNSHLIWFSDDIPSPWTMAVELTGTGTTVATDIEQTQFNELFNACPVVKYTRNSGVHAVYVRRAGRAEVDAYSLFTYLWASSNNVLGTDFDIYSSEADARSETGAWTFCNYDDPDVGFPRDCGVTGAVGNTWFTMPSAGQHDASSGGGAQRFDIRNINNGASFEIYTGADCPAASLPVYNLGQSGGGDNCPAGTDVSEADCLAAAQSLLGSGQTQGRTNLVAGSWGWVPPGCSIQTHFTHNQNGDFAAHYNRGSGANDGGYTKVCNMECQHLTNMDVVSGTFGHYGLDYSNSPSDEDCSATCTADPQCTAWVRQPSTGNCWISNQAVVNFEADTDRTTGLRCN